MDQPAGVKPIPTPPARRRADSSARDAFVLIAMCVVVVAIGIGLYLHFETGFLLALVAALAAYSGLLSVHVLVRRSQVIADLKAENARLHQQITEMRRGPGLRAQEAGLGVVHQQGRPAPVRSEEAALAAAGVVPGSGRRPASLGASGPQSGPPALPPAPPHGQRSPGAIEPPRGWMSPPDAEQATPSPAPSLVPPAPITATPPSIRAAAPMAPAPSGTGEDNSGPLQTPDTTGPAAKAASSQPVNEASARSRATPDSSPLTPGLIAAEQASEAGAPSASDAITTPLDGEEDARKNRVAERLQEIGSAVQQIVSTSAELETGVPAGQAPRSWPQTPRYPLEAPQVSTEQVATPADAHGQGPETVTPAASALPFPSPVPASPVASTERPESAVREFETMQLLIKQLAVQLNAPAPVVSHEATSALASEAITQSVAVLRTTADSMRDADRDADDGDDEADVTPPLRGREITREPSPEPSLAAFVPAIEASAATPSATPPSPWGRLALIAEAVSAERIDVYLDPILALDERRARHFEVSVRLRTNDEEEIDAEQYLALAGETGLLPRIDAAKLDRTARVAERLRARGSNGSLFSALAGESLADDGFLNSFADLFGTESEIPSQLVLTFSQRDVRAFTEAHWDAISTMSDLGLRFALDHVSDLDMDFERLRASGFTFVKLDAAVFLEGLPAAHGTIPAADICGHLSGLGLGLIVGHIEDELALAKIAGFGVLFGQGTLFGAPRPVRVDVQPSTVAA